eukprot:3307120-Rhodomonas_salina.2
MQPAARFWRIFWDANPMAIPILARMLSSPWYREARASVRGCAVSYERMCVRGAVARTHAHSTIYRIRTRSASYSATASSISPSETRRV